MIPPGLGFRAPAPAPEPFNPEAFPALFFFFCSSALLAGGAIPKKYGAIGLVGGGGGGGVREREMEMVLWSKENAPKMKKSLVFRKEGGKEEI